jgi:hypothetical protein
MKSSSFAHFERWLVFGVVAAALGYGVKSWLNPVPPVPVAVKQAEGKKAESQNPAKPRPPGKKPGTRKVASKPSKKGTQTRQDDADDGVPWLKEAEMPAVASKENVDKSLEAEPKAARKPGERMSERAWGQKFAKIHHNMHPDRKKPRPIPPETEAELDAIDDVNAVEPIWTNFAGHAPHHRIVCLVLDGIQSKRSTEYLVALAVYSPDEVTRESAAKALIGRKPYDFALPLIELIRGPLVPKREVINDPNLGRFEVLVVGDEKVDRRFLYPEPASPLSPDCGWNLSTADSPYMTKAQKLAWTEFNRQQQEFARDMRRLQIEDDLEQVKRMNMQIAENKARALKTLSIATHLEYRDRNRWSTWLETVTGRKYSPPRDTARQTVLQVVQPLYQPTFVTVPKLT